MFSPPPESAGEQAAVDQIGLKATTMPGLDEHGEPRFLENVKLFLFEVYQHLPKLFPRTLSCKLNMDANFS